MPKRQPCADCQGSGRHYSTHRPWPRPWGAIDLNVVIWTPVGCFFCGGKGRVAPERTDREIRDEFAAALS